MEQLLADQFNRLTDSIARLTRGTTLDGTSVSLGRPTAPERLAFGTRTPAGDQLINCYQGILLEALKGWTDESLDRRLYEASDVAFRHLLNRPGGIHAADDGDESAGISAAPDQVLVADHSALVIQTGCSRCRELLGEIQAKVARLHKTTQQGSMVCRQRPKNCAQDFIGLLTSHLEIQRELRRLHQALALHRQNHSPEQRCRRFITARD